ncbi:nuclear transport factor 2 family protein [Actinomadura sp. LOL_016]|uniref:nuclear transport factor 2 family protein n=1 Tax=unclassified Actinomadura TaxID=2626254 RepID=UPI003A806C56
MDLADRFLTAITSGDTGALRAMYAPDATIWHNDDGRQELDDNLRTLRWLSRNLRDMRYEVLRRDALPDGYVQRHVLRGALPDGAPFELHACLFVTVRDGRIVRLEEYADSRGSDPLRDLAAAQRAARTGARTDARA